MRCLGSDGVHAVFDGGGVVCFVGRCREDDSVGGLDGAAAVDEVGVDSAVLSGAEGGQIDVLAGFAVDCGLKRQDDARRAGVAGEVAANDSRIGKFCSWLAGGRSIRNVAPTLPLSKVMQTRLSCGQHPGVCPMKLSRSAGSLTVSAWEAKRSFRIGSGASALCCADVLLSDDRDIRITSSDVASECSWTAERTTS